MTSPITVRRSRSGTATMMIVFVALFFACDEPRFAAPPPMSFAERADKASVVVLADIVDVSQRPISDTSRAISMRVVTGETLRGNAPAEFEMAFLVFPQTFENHMRGPVSTGRYILFLTRESVSASDGALGEALVPIEPRGFAFVSFSEDNLAQIREVL